ncbi:cobalamin synthesis protein [Pseudozyma hubeiensis SY62]|uniref:Cobalamin synthesis protein n=1 Tax=Pseudozyma hubeiensis (strain SY62) TaxID=1305764 RepID=R9P4A5_PSEHS|nr:cobalamin synthesis protein [Pseudozyma hubeiensis SY62]GAC96263.1 cobalamin synthesis protein [Pseudozyma hubeiensis SY62]
MSDNTTNPVGDNIYKGRDLDRELVGLPRSIAKAVIDLSNDPEAGERIEPEWADWDAIQERRRQSRTEISFSSRKLDHHT